MAKEIRQGKIVTPHRWRSRLIGVLVFLALFGGLIAVLSVVRVTQYAVYADPRLGVQIKYPTYWTATPRSEPGAVAAFLTPLTGPLDDFQENVVLTFVSVQDGTDSLSRFSQTAIQQVTGTFQGMVEVLVSKKIYMGDRPGYLFSYAGRGGDPDLAIRYQHWWTFINGRAYIVTYVAREKNLTSICGRPT